MERSVRALTRKTKSTGRVKGDRHWGSGKEKSSCLTRGMGKVVVQQSRVLSTQLSHLYPRIECSRLEAGMLINLRIRSLPYPAGDNLEQLTRPIPSTSRTSVIVTSPKHFWASQLPGR